MCNVCIGKRPTESKTGRAPAFSFGSRHNGKNDSIGPGPGQYNVTGLSAKGLTFISSQKKILCFFNILFF